MTSDVAFIFLKIVIDSKTGRRKKILKLRSEGEKILAQKFRLHQAISTVKGFRPNCQTGIAFTKEELLSEKFIKIFIDNVTTMTK